MRLHEDGATTRGRTNRVGDGSVNVTQPGKLGKAEKPKHIDTVKEWEKVKVAWKGNVSAWQRYSGLKLPDDYTP